MAVTETYANNAVTTLNGAINNSVTSLVVNSAAAFPATPQFRIYIDTELLLVTGVAGTTFTVTRGVEGTTAASHNNGATVTHILSSGGLIGVAGSTCLDGSYSTLPATGVVGRSFFPSDGGHLFRDSGTDWLPWGPIFPMVRLQNAQYSWVNQGTASLITSGGTFGLRPPLGGTSDNIVARVKSLSAVSGYTYTMAFLPKLVFPSNFNACGMVLRDSGTGKLVTFHLVADSIQASTDLIIGSIKWTNPTTFSGAYTLTPSVGNGVYAFAWTLGPCMWFRIQDDGTNRLFSVSNDGSDFLQVFSVGRTDFITPDQIGFFVNNYNATYPVGINVLSFTGG